MVNPQCSEDSPLHEALSAVADGRATREEWQRVSAAWASDASLRERWAVWHAAGDGLRAAELPPLHRDPEALLAALHARMPAVVTPHPRRRDWFAPLAVAAGFVVMAVGLVSWQPAPAPEPLVAALPMPAPGVQGLGGLSFAQAAAGPTLAGLGVPRDTGLSREAPPEFVDWGLVLPEPVAKHPGR